LWRGPVRTDVAVEVSVVQHIVGVPLGGESQLRVDLDVVGAACLMLHGVNVGDHAVVGPLVVRYERVVVTIRMCVWRSQGGASGQDNHGG
jgi:hypothetical protein